MTQLSYPMTRRATDPSAWINHLFSAKAAMSGGVIRRNIGWVEAEVGRRALTEEVQRRGFHMIECGGQFVIICNRGGLRVVC